MLDVEERVLEPVMSGRIWKCLVSDILGAVLLGGGSGRTRNGEGLGVGMGGEGLLVWGKEPEGGFKGAPERRQALGQMGA